MQNLKMDSVINLDMRVNTLLLELYIIKLYLKMDYLIFTNLVQSLDFLHVHL